MGQLSQPAKDIIKANLEDISSRLSLNLTNTSEAYNADDCLKIHRSPRKNKIFPMNFILYGAPGTGKTYHMVDYAVSIIENKSYSIENDTKTNRQERLLKYKRLLQERRIAFTTFHQNYGYEEFIQGLRPKTESENLSFELADGVFKKIADRALKDLSGNNYVIIIDEINRANISKVFGELITLIEEDKRWGEVNETCVTLQSGEIFTVPNNLYIIGTMNSADKSISLIDAALRRRFSFIEQLPDSTLIEDKSVRVFLEVLNLKLVDELDSTDLLVGHSYFLNKSINELCDVLNNNIIPLLYEYFYDNKRKVATILQDTIEQSRVDIEVVDEKVGRLKVKQKENVYGTE